ncbi:MAG: DUF739 family protein [Eubacteriales bacterium]
MFVKFNYTKLIKKIVDVFGSNDAFAAAMSMSKKKVDSRLHNCSEFSLPEIERAVELLYIKPIDIPGHFFAV